MGIIAGIAIPTTIAVIDRQKTNAAKNSAGNVMTAAETVLLEAAANPGNKPSYVTADSSKTGAYQVTIKDLVDYGELKENPLEDATKDTIYIYINDNNKCFWSVDTVKINGKTVTVGTTASSDTTTDGD